MASAEDRIKQLQEDIRGTDESALKERVYVCVANGCILLTAYLNSKGQKGWSSRLVDNNGQSILNGNEQKALESILEKAPWVLDFFKGEPKVQKGGAMNDVDISLDKGLDQFIQLTEETDNYWKNVEKNSFGNIKTFMNTDQIIPTPIGPVPIKPRLISKLLITLLDFLRLSSARAGNSNIPLTLIVFLEELVTGQWRQMILTAASLFITPSGVATSIMIKYVIIAWLNIGGNERTRLVKDISKGAKSFIRNFLIWCFAVLTPGPIKSSMFGMQMPQMPQIPQIPQVQIPHAMHPQIPQPPPLPPRRQVGGSNEITYEVIQEKLKILDNPALLCSPGGKGLVEEVTSDPILGLVAELFDIPSTETLERVCPVALTMNSFDAAEELEPFEPEETEPSPPEPVPQASVPQAPVPQAPVPQAPVSQKGGRKSKKMNKRKAKKSRKRNGRY
jgi:hypothetical protein